MLKCSVHGRICIATRIGYISGRQGGLSPPPPKFSLQQTNNNRHGCLAELLPLSSHKRNSLCGHEKYTGMLLILAQAGPLNLALLPPSLHFMLYVPAPCMFPRCILICVVFLTGPEVMEVLCVPSSFSQQASGVNFNFVMTMVSTLKMHVTQSRDYFNLSEFVI